MKFSLNQPAQLFGFLNILKPSGLTSHDVVARLRKVLKIKQIGHTGTLDPLAEGVLPVAVGKASRLIEYLADDKAYVAKMQFGKVSDTYDTEGNVVDFSDKKITSEILNKELLNFKGTITQIPPAYSAVHYNGKRLYELAREGIIPEDIPKREVFIERIELINFDEQNQTAQIEIACSKGTYIRSIVHDLGQNLGCGAVMTGLLRTKAGLFDISTAVKLDDIKCIQDVLKHLQNPLEVMPYKKYKLTGEEAQKVQHGQSIIAPDKAQDEYFCLVFENKLCAIAAKTQGRFVAKKVFI